MARHSTNIKTVEITKIGRKFFHTESFGRFFIEDMKHDGGQYNSNWQAYLSMEEIKEENERSSLIVELETTHWHHMPTDKLKRIKEIITQ